MSIYLSISLYIYICIYVCMYVCMCIYIYIYVAATVDGVSASSESRLDGLRVLLIIKNTIT